MIFIGGLIALAVNSIVIMLYLAKVPCFGALSIAGVVIGAVMTLSGHSWVTLVTGAVYGVLGDAVAQIGRYRRPVLNAAAYSVFQLWAVGIIVPIIINTEKYLREVATTMNNPAYAEAMRELFSPVVLFSWTPINVIVCFLCGLVGMRVLRRHFVPAGVV
ncbi:hypothetical protein GCM10009621_01330 [Corynebacterium felinum]